jgi:poly-gamma-glutamate synthesis protein (capsule biosynthesis protein)
MILSLLVASVLVTDRNAELNAVGDIMLARGVQRYIRKPDSLPLLRGVHALLKGDIVMGNLESPLTTLPTQLTKQFVFRGDPQNLSQIVPDFTVLSVANNHTLDCGRQGLDETLRTLASRGIDHLGTDGLTVKTVKGIRIGLLAYCDFPRPEKGIAYLSEEALSRDIAKAKASSDVCVVSVHWGEEYHQQPNARQKHIARLATRLGASLIVGHHPHVLQPIEWVRVGSKKCLVAYSLGNFIFDSHPPLAKLSGVLKCRLSKRGVESYRFVPMVVEHYAPRPSSAVEHAEISRKSVGIREAG